MIIYKKEGCFSGKPREICRNPKEEKRGERGKKNKLVLGLIYFRYQMVNKENRFDLKGSINLQRRNYSMSKGFKTEKYDFFDFFQTPVSVQVGIRRVDEQNITNEDLEELGQFFNDMGKWQSLMKAGISLIEDLGIFSISETIKETYQKEFGAENYIIELERADERVMRVKLRLTSEECLRRSEGKRDSMQLPEEEIIRQVKNVPKWRALSKVISQIRSTRQ